METGRSGDGAKKEGFFAPPFLPGRQSAPESLLTDYVTVSGKGPSDSIFPCAARPRVFIKNSSSRRKV